MTTTTRPTRPAGCDRPTAVTRSLLGYGVVAGPLYVLVSLAQALTRDGFDLSRHAWSMLANGEFGWIQIANLMLTGAMTVAFAVGLRRAGAPAARLVGAYGISMILAGIFRADAGQGFPAGTPDGPGEVSWHGMLHLIVAGVGFLCLVAACLLTARRFAAASRRGWAAYSLVTGVLFLGAFVGIASGAGSSATVLGFVAAVVLAWAWVAALAVHHYRRVNR